MRVLIAGVVVLVMLLGVGCGGESTEKNDSAETPTQTKQDNAGTVEETTGPRERTEATTGFEFEVGRTPMDEESPEGAVGGPEHQRRVAPFVEPHLSLSA